MTRRRITNAMKARIFLAGFGKCFLCGLKIDAQKQPWEAHHVIPLWLGGADTEANMRPLHVRCHAMETAGDAPVRAKSNRVRTKHLGLRKRQSRPMVGSKASGWKKTFNEGWVRR